jgi:hypothetical protein
VRAFQQGGKVPLEAECPARAAAAEGGRVENDRIKFFPAFDQAPEKGGNILGNEAVSLRRDLVQFEVSSAPLEGGFGNIHADRLSSTAGCGDREGAGVGKSIENTLGPAFLQKKAVQALVWKKPRRVLNTFAYTCAFSVAAASVGAETVSVDVSKSSLQRGRRNFELNRIPAEGHRFIPEDVPTFLRHLIKRGEAFDAIILDPPTFGRSGAGKTFRFERDFPALLECALRLSAPGGAMLLSTNFTAWDKAALIECARGILPSKTKFHKIPTPADFFGNAPSATVWALL